jgi:hypothetical protein
LTLRVEVRFEPRSLVRANDGLDLGPIGARYAEAVRAAITRDFPAAEVEVRADAGVRGVSAAASGVGDDEARRVERTALDLAWVVRETMAFG